MMAVEIDARSVDKLRGDLPKLQVLHQDLLQLNHSELAKRMGGQLHVVGNLPYCITSEALLSLVSCPGALRYALVMVQKEAAQRVVAPPGSKDYGPLSAVLQLFARPRQLFSVPPTAFYPPPKVVSAIVELDFLAVEDLPKVPPEQLLEVIKAAFRQRKRALKHSLAELFQERRRGAVLPPRWASLRAETLCPGDFVELTRFVYPRWQRADGTQARLDIMFTADGERKYIDLTVRHPRASKYRSQAARMDGAAALTAEAAKRIRYPAVAVAGLLAVEPFCVESFGRLGLAALALLHRARQRAALRENGGLRGWAGIATFNRWLALLSCSAQFSKRRRQLGGGLGHLRRSCLCEGR
ncbi:unnamed protein product, partial [Polarella glacialis]